MLIHLRERSFRLFPGRDSGIIRERGAGKQHSAGSKTLHIATSTRWRSAAMELRAGIAWGLVVLGITLAILVLGAIVLPAQAYETPANVPSAHVHCDQQSADLPAVARGDS